MRSPASSHRLLLCVLAACAATATASPSPALTAAPTPTSTFAQTRTPLPPPPCARYVPDATPVSSIKGVPGIKLPKGTYSNAGTHSGGGTGRYIVTIYTLCFHSTEADIGGGPMPPHGSPTSTIGFLAQAGWVLNNLFPDPTNVEKLPVTVRQPPVSSSISGTYQAPGVAWMLSEWKADATVATPGLPAAAPNTTHAHVRMQPRQAPARMACHSSH